MLIALYIIAGLIVLLFLAALVLPSSYSVEKNIIIKKAPAFVHTHIADLGYYSKWNPWQQTDPTATGTITGTPGEAGHKYEWSGKKVGVGSLTLLKQDAQHIHFALEFIKPWASKASDNWMIESWGDGTDSKVTWQNNGLLPFPVYRLMGPILNKMLNKQFEQGLLNLKKMCEEA